MEQLTWVEINREHLFHNINVIESHTQSEIMYGLKANAYGN